MSQRLKELAEQKNPNLFNDNQLPDPEFDNQMKQKSNYFKLIKTEKVKQNGTNGDTRHDSEF